MSTPVVIAKENDTIARIRNLMLSQNVGRIIIINENGKPSGIVTQKDIMNTIDKKSPKWRRRPLDTILIKNIMSKDLTYIKSDNDVIQAAKILKKNGFSALPVLDKNKLVGIISKTDIVKALPSLIGHSIQVNRFMTKKLITAKPAHSILHIHDLMLENNISRIIIEENEQPLGVVTSKDIVFIKQKDIETASKQKIFLHRGESVKISPTRPQGSAIILTDEIMNRNLITIKENDSVINAAKKMIGYDIGGLPVIAEDPPHKLVGIITKRDIINGIAGGKV
jgi:CBS domain-containing protein